MNQRLVWNFEFSSKAPLALAYPEDKEDQFTWEFRYFWPEHEIIILNLMNHSLPDLANYQKKSKEDYYYLLPGLDYNIKRRRNKLLYKPLLQYKNQAAAYGTKIILNDPQIIVTNPDLHLLVEHVEKEGIEIYVKKESFIYKFPGKPTVKMELARLEVLNKIYFSLCIEGKSLLLVETIAQHLLEEALSCDYVTFLKNLVQP